MPSPKRPNKITVLEAWETKWGSVECWAEAKGTVLHFMIHPRTFVTRRLAFGYAEIQPVVRDDGVEDELVDVDSEATHKTLVGILTEFFDHFDELGLQWDEFEAPGLVAENYVKRRPDIEGEYTLRSKAPERKPPKRRNPQDRRVNKDRDLSSIITRQIMGRG